MITRRVALLGGGTALAAVGLAGVAVDHGLLPGRYWLDAHLGLNGADGHIPDVRPGRIVRGRFTSRRRGGVETKWALMLPPGRRDARGLPLVVALHWLGGSTDALIGHDLGLPEYLADHVRRGGHPMAVLAADGGSSYWHPHDGEDSSAMVTDELLPLMRRLGVDPTRRLGLIGWSMGGYGVLRLAGLLGSRRVAGVSAVSPALWTDPDEASRSGFDDAAEYTRYSVMGRQSALRGVRVRVDCGTHDPFADAARSYVDGFGSGDVSSSFETGGHDPGYWRRMLPADLDFLDRALSALK